MPFANRLQASPFLLVSVLLTIRIAIAFIFLIIDPTLADSSPLPTMTDSKIGDFFVVILFAPMLETCLAQMLPTLVTKKDLDWRWYIPTSATVFALLHFTSVFVFTQAFLAGAIYAAAYYLQRTRNPFIVTVSVHGGYNLFAYLANNF